jgi:hypothetical protein
MSKPMSLSEIKRIRANKDFSHYGKIIDEWLKRMIELTMKQMEEKENSDD